MGGVWQRDTGRECAIGDKHQKGKKWKSNLPVEMTQAILMRNKFDESLFAILINFSNVIGCNW